MRLIMGMLREKMIISMQVRGLAEGTCKHYLRAVEGLTRHYNRSPDTLTQTEILEYINYLLKDKKISNQYCNTIIGGIKFFYGAVLNDNARAAITKIANARQRLKLPVILSIQEIELIFKNTLNLKELSLFMIAYGAGLRSSEVVNLKVSDIDSQRMVIRIQKGKMSKDRYALLSPKMLEVLRAYWKQYQPKDWLFPCQFNSKQHLKPATPTMYFKRAKLRAGIKKSGGLHSLRHAFATHLLEEGNDIFRIQHLMGHTRIQTTTLYLQASSAILSSTTSPMDKLQFDDKDRIVRCK